MHFPDCVPASIATKRSSASHAHRCPRWYGTGSPSGPATWLGGHFSGLLCHSGGSSLPSALALAWNAAICLGSLGEKLVQVKALLL